MVGSIPVTQQVEESRVLDFDNSTIVVGFFMDVCKEDLDTLSKYYSTALKNAYFIRQQNMSRVRNNTKYLDYLEQDIARLESRWVLPLTKTNNIFASAIEFTDVPPKNVKQPSPTSGVEVTDVNKTQVQSQKKWLDEPAIIQLKGVGLKPYQQVNKQLRQLRQRRSQYKFLELYFIEVGRQVLNLQANLRVILAVIKVVQKYRAKLQETGQRANNSLGQLVQEIISSNTLDDAVNKLNQFNPDILMGSKGKGGPAGNENAQQSSALTDATGDRSTLTPMKNAGTGIKPQTSGAVPAKTPNPPTINPTGINPNQTQKNARNL